MIIDMYFWTSCKHEIKINYYVILQFGDLSFITSIAFHQYNSLDCYTNSVLDLLALVSRLVSFQLLVLDLIGKYCVFFVLVFLEMVVINIMFILLSNKHLYAYNLLVLDAGIHLYIKQGLCLLVWDKWN